MIKSKPRGLRRKCRNMVRRIEEETKLLPPCDAELHFWHLHLPVAQKFIDSQRTPFKVRRLCVRTLIERAHHLWRVAPEEEIRVVAAINLPELWASQIIVFFGSSHFDKFFERDGEEQKWSLIENRSLIKEWQFQLPSGFQERVYNEMTSDNEAVSKSRIWFIGDLNK